MELKLDMKKNDLHEVYCLGSIPVDAGRLCFYDLLEKKIKKTFNERKLTKEIKENKKLIPLIQILLISLYLLMVHILVMQL